MGVPLTGVNPSHLMNLFTYEKGYCFVYYLSQLCGDPQRFDSFLRVSGPLPETGPARPPRLCPNSQGCPSPLVVGMEWRGPVSGAGTRPSLRAVPGVLPPLPPSLPVLTTWQGPWGSSGCLRGTLGPAHRSVQTPQCGGPFRLCRPQLWGGWWDGGGVPSPQASRALPLPQQAYVEKYKFTSVVAQDLLDRKSTRLNSSH